MDKQVDSSKGYQHRWLPPKSGRRKGIRKFNLGLVSIETFDSKVYVWKHFQKLKTFLEIPSSKTKSVLQMKSHANLGEEKFNKQIKIIFIIFVIIYLNFGSKQVLSSL